MSLSGWPPTSVLPSDHRPLVACSVSERGHTELYTHEPTPTLACLPALRTASNGYSDSKASSSRPFCRHPRSHRVDCPQPAAHLPDSGTFPKANIGPHVPDDAPLAKVPAWCPSLPYSSPTRGFVPETALSPVLSSWWVRGAFASTKPVTYKAVSAHMAEYRAGALLRPTPPELQAQVCVLELWLELKPFLEASRS